MDFSHSDKVRGLQERLRAFMDRRVYPAEAAFHEEVAPRDDPKPPSLGQTRRLDLPK